MQDRFYTLIRHRLRAEIEQNPPRFPWESEVYDYEENLDSAAPAFLPVHLWTTQLQTLELPIPMPDALLTQLFEQCQAIVQSSLREGVKLVQAVEALFPEQTPALNQLASLVLTGPTRSAALAEPDVSFPDRYDAANVTQQMAVALLAAQRILSATTLQLSAHQPTVDRHWTTAVGAVALRADYHDNRLRIEGHLPGQGSLQLKGETSDASAYSSTAGKLSVELSGVELNQTYALEIQLSETPDPLVFAVHLNAES